MKLKILKNIFISGKAYKIGDIVNVSPDMKYKFLLDGNFAEEYIEKTQDKVVKTTKRKKSED